MSKYLKLSLLIVALLAVFTIGASAKIYVIDNMDDASLWTGNGTVILETENIKEGTGAVRIDSDSLLQLQRVFETPMDLSEYEDDGVISVWVYVDNIDSFAERDNSLEFTSSGTCDQMESAVMLGTEWFEEGWNHFLFTMSDFASYDADWSSINYIRAYKFVEGSNYWIWDDFKIGLESDFGIGRVKVSSGAKLVESFDDENAFTVDTVNMIEGTGCATATSTAPVTISHKYETPMDLSVLKENGYVYIWLYVEDAAAIQTSDGQFELTSSGESDKNELSWVIPAVAELHDGWNELLLEVDPDTDCDLSAVNYMRLYLFSDTENTVKLDRLMVGTGPDFGIKPETEPVTEPPATEAPATAAPDDDGDSGAGGVDEPGDVDKTPDSNQTLILIIVAAAVIIIIVIIIIVVNSKKKKK